MDEIRLTKDAGFLLRKLYKEYEKRRENGESRLDAKMFGSSEDICRDILPNRNVDDITEACWELDRFGFMECVPGDDIVQISALTDFGIEWMEGRFRRGIFSILNGVKELLSFIPFGGE